MIGTLFGALDALADAFFGGSPQTPTEWDRLFSFRRGFRFGVGFSAAVVVVTVVLVLL